MTSVRTLLICLDDSLKPSLERVKNALNFSLFKESRDQSFIVSSSTLSATMVKMFTVAEGKGRQAGQRQGVLNIIFFFQLAGSARQSVEVQYENARKIITEILDYALIFEFDYSSYAFVLMPPVTDISEKDKKGYLTELKFLDTFPNPFHHLFLFGCENPGIVLTASQQEKLVEIFACSIVSPHLGKMIKNYLDIVRGGFYGSSNMFFSPGVAMINLADDFYRQATYGLAAEVFFEQLSGISTDHKRLHKQAEMFVADFFFDPSFFSELFSVEKNGSKFNLIDEVVDLDRNIDIREIFVRFTDYFQKQTASILIDHHMDFNYLRLVLVSALEQVNQLAGETEAKHSIRRRDEIINEMDKLSQKSVVRNTFFSRFVALFQRQGKLPIQPSSNTNIANRLVNFFSRQCHKLYGNIFKTQIEPSEQKKLDPQLRTSNALRVMRLKVLRDFFDYVTDLMEDNISEIDKALSSFRSTVKTTPYSDDASEPAAAALSSPFLFNLLPMASMNGKESSLLAKTIFAKFRNKYEDLLCNHYRSINVEFMMQSMLPYEFLQSLKIRFDELYFETLENEILKIQCHSLMDSLVDRDTFRHTVAKKIIACSLPFVSFFHRGLYQPKIFYSSENGRLCDTYRGLADYFLSDRVVDAFSPEGLSIVQLTGPFRISELNIYSVLEDNKQNKTV